MGRFNSAVGSTISAVGALTFRSKTNSVDLLQFDPADNRVQIDRFFGFGTLTAPNLRVVLPIEDRCYSCRYH